MVLKVHIFCLLSNFLNDLNKTTISNCFCFKKPLRYIRKCANLFNTTSSDKNKLVCY